jgi:hypothetical protein
MKDKKQCEGEKRTAMNSRKCVPLMWADQQKGHISLSVRYETTREGVHQCAEAYAYFLAYFPYFEKMKVGLWGHVAVCVSACLCIPPINFRTPEPVFIKLGTYITAPEPISTA